MLKVIGASAVGSPFVTYKSDPLVRDDYSATFTTSMMLKDIELVLTPAEERRVELPFSQQLAGLLASAVDRGHADLDFMSLFLQLREISGRQPHHQVQLSDEDEYRSSRRRSGD